MEKRHTIYEDLGSRRYREVWEMQEKVLEETRERKLQGKVTSNYLFFVEHLPVYTLGKSGKEGNMLIDTIQLRARHAEFIKVDRGGDITFHGPGQLVAYPVIDLENFGWGVKEYVHELEEVVIRSIREYGIEGCRVEGATGVWLEAGSSRERKICAIGVKCSRYITMHGFALNVNTDLSYFNYIHPCGFIDKGVTSLEKELGHKVSMEEVKQVVLRCFREVMGMEII
ncbi:lipoyl(octanoyl) transferase LipB [Culturomica massiliensis]|jgi:lipoyl(octanoyl) transferase|uniref:lipoyl(octanoyl) transferase LipB n=1 Tax=Culturomica massiliensis TaxID=1841857 RepID=UPI00033AFE56|nr:MULTISPECIES: lipoyl(octanoyl) transferase LipB [Odoribacteraceae]RHV93178.1 lipoyl(octanoyl) transferase LipB [Odoribacter sp. OF09-27XD]CCZ06154.1 octanoyltransferase [Odoribacter sp. CAG:788]